MYRYLKLFLMLLRRTSPPPWNIYRYENVLFILQHIIRTIYIYKKFHDMNHPRSQGFSAACVAVSPGTSRTGTPQILVFSGSERALLQAKNADYALIFTEEWRRVGEQKYWIFLLF
jgi:hypothetical protein